MKGYNFSASLFFSTITLFSPLPSFFLSAVKWRWIKNKIGVQHCAIYLLFLLCERRGQMDLELEASLGNSLFKPQKGE